jgi:hypothetical protein
MDGIDRMTLELLMNKTQYTKYLAIQDPNKYNEVKEHQSKVERYMDTIMEITEEYCANHTKQNSNELDDAFRDYAKSCIRFIEMKAMEQPFKAKEEDGDVMFEHVVQPIAHSLWGKATQKQGERKEPTV